MRTTVITGAALRPLEPTALRHSRTCSSPPASRAAPSRDCVLSPSVPGRGHELRAEEQQLPGSDLRSAAASILSTSEQGGARLAHLVVGSARGMFFVRGAYYAAPDRIGRSHRMARDPGEVARHWELTSELLGLDW